MKDYLEAGYSKIVLYMTNWNQSSHYEIIWIMTTTTTKKNNILIDSEDLRCSTTIRSLRCTRGIMKDHCILVHYTVWVCSACCLAVLHSEFEFAHDFAESAHPLQEGKPLASRTMNIARWFAALRHFWHPSRGAHTDWSCTAVALPGYSWF